MLREPRRLIASIIAISVGVAFAAATFFLSASLEKSINAQVAGPANGASLVVSAQDSSSPVPESLLTTLRGLPGVTKVHGVASSYVEQKTGGGTQYLILRELPDPDYSTTVVDGRLPKATGEVAFTEQLARARKVTVGSTIAVYSPDQTQTATLTVVGIISNGKEYGDPSGTYAVATAGDLFRWPDQTGSGYPEAYVFGGDPSSLKATVSAMSEVTSRNLEVQTGDEYLQKQRESVKQVLTGITNFFLGFAAIALLVGALVIANTFSILVAQRSRQLALLRCVGASRGQVFRTVIGEALLMGLIGGAVGVIGGGVFAFLLVQLAKTANLGLDQFALSLNGVVVPLAIAVLITLFAAFRPALRATRVAPLAALQPQLVPISGRRASVPVLIVGAVLAVAGVAGLLYAAIKPGWTSATNVTYIVVGIAGGVVSMVGVLMLGTVIVPAMARLLGTLPSRLGGVPGRLAAENSRRNPARATATASALLIGITLISMAAVGAATASATEQRSLDRLFPSDLTVSAPQGISDTVLQRLRDVSVVAAAEKTAIGAVTLNGGTDPETVIGMGPGIRDVLRYPSYVDGLADDTIIVPEDMKIPNGSTVTVTGDEGTVSLRAVVLPTSPASPVVTLTTLGRLTQRAIPQAWVKLTDTSDPGTKIESISNALQDVDGLQISGGVQGRQQIQQVLNIVLGVVIGLLAASVLVAIVGISNTLGLSVLERTRESALLRALGLTRPQLRGMFGTEAMVLAGVGVILGILLGLGYGIAGSYALLGKSVSQVVLDIPWLALLGILAFGLGAGWLASVLPSLRAGKVQPAAALAAE